MRKSQLVQKRKVALLATVRLMRVLLQDLEDNQRTFNRLVVALDKLTDGDSVELDLDTSALRDELEEWERVVADPKWPS